MFSLVVIKRIIGLVYICRISCDYFNLVVLLEISLSFNIGII